MSTVEFFGEQFTLSGEISEFALLEFADAADSGGDGDSMAGMAAILRLLRECVAEDDWARFRKTARTKKAKSDDLLTVIKAAMEAQTEHPTGRPSDSSDGPAAIEPKSEPKPDDRVSQLFPGRPDLQLAVARARQTA